MPIQIVQDYELTFVYIRDTLLITVSYSGNTEETVSILKRALNLDKRPMIIVICSGGELEEIATKNQLPFLKIPADYQPRMTFGYQLRALAEIIEQAGLGSNLISQLETSSTNLDKILDSFIETQTTTTNLAKQIALE